MYACSVCLSCPVCFLAPFPFYLSASAPSNVLVFFFSSKICASQDWDERDANAMHIFWAALSSLSLPLLSLYIPPVLFLPHGVSSIGSSFFQYSLGWVATLPCFTLAIVSASFAFFLLPWFSYVRGARVLEPLRDTYVISKSDLGHSPCRGRGMDSGKRVGNRVFLFFFC